jgi:membrane protein DedA with SNARE-associated domain
MLTQLLDTLTAWLESLLLTGGALGIVVIALMENIFPPTPSEFLYPLAGKLAFDGKVGLVEILVAAVGGSLVGALIFYHVGYYLGDERVRIFLAKYGTWHIWRWRWTIFSVEAYERATQAFAKRGGIIVMVGRTMPFIHGVISIPAGVVRMNRLRFLLYSALGVLLWVVPTVLLGYWLGSQWQNARAILDAYEVFWYGVLVVIVLYYARRWWRHRQTHKLQNEHQ